MFGHFIEEGVGLKTVEIKDGEGIDPVFDGRGEEDSFVCYVLLDLVEIVFLTGANCCCHNLEYFDVCIGNIVTSNKKFKLRANFLSSLTKRQHPKTFILQDKKDACQSPASEETIYDWFWY